VIAAVAIVDSGFKNGNFLFGDDCAAQAADQLFGFSAEHASANYFNPTNVPLNNWNHSNLHVLIHNRGQRYSITIKEQTFFYGLEIGRLPLQLF
jgi:hypothetical protein